MMKLSNSYFRRQIEHHFDEMDLDVVVRKRRHAYALYWEDDDEPLAKLRPTGRDDEVEVYCWENDRWERVKETDVVQPLDEALKYITDDPADRFFDNDSDEDEDEDEDENDGLEWEPKEPKTLQEACRSVYSQLLTCSIFGAAVGGMFSDLWWGLAASAMVATMVCSIPNIITSRRTLLREVAISTIAAPFAFVGSITGSAVNEGLGSGRWSIACGVIVGVSCSWMLFRGGVLAWSAGLLAGLNLANALLGIWYIENHFGSLLFVAFVAAMGASVCRTVMLAPFVPHTESMDAD
jgi:hypothetical protein